MTANDKRKVKEVNGFKVNHPFSAGNIAFAIFTLILIGLPVGLLFFPLVSFPSDPTIHITGLDIINYTIVALFMPEGVIPEGIQTLFSFFTEEGKEFYRELLVFILYGQAGIFAILSFNSLLALICFMFNIIKGYLRHSGFVKAIASLNFVYYILFGLTFIGILVVFAIAASPTEIFVWFGLIPTGAMFVLLIVISSIRNCVYRDVIYEADLEFKDDDKEQVVQEANIHTITVKNYEPANTLPENIDSIGGHAYAENQNLFYANIPNNIDKLGPGAFANCLKLKIVSIPTSVKEIGFNCFFNCVSLERINYAGTKEQWRHVKRGSNWLAKAKTSEVICTDGAIVVNPFH